MKLNNITSLHQRAPINGKDVNFDFILEELESTYSIIHGKYCHAMYVEDDDLVEVRYVEHGSDTIHLKSKYPEDSIDKVAHAIADPINNNRETDLYAKIHCNPEERNRRSISFYHTNTDVLKCQYKFDYDGKTYEGEFFLDMLNSDVYDGIHEGCPGIHEDWPDEYMFGKVIGTGIGTSGFEVQVRLNANKADVAVTEAVVYLWKECPDGHLENYDTIDNAEITIINIDTNELINQ